MKSDGPLGDSERSLQLFRSLVKLSNDALYVIDPLTGRFLSINDRACDRLGYERAEMLQMAVRDIQVLLPDEESWRRMVADVRAAGNKLLEGIHRCKDGTTFPVEVSVSFVTIDNQDYMVAVARDITERKQAEAALRISEARLKEAQQIAKLGSWELDLATSKLVWSDEIYRIFEIDLSQFGASYEAFLNAVHPEDREKVDATYRGSLESGEDYEIVHRLLMPDGRVKFVQELGCTFYGESGRPLRSVGTVQDITERMQAKERLRLSERRLRQVIDSCFGFIGLYDVDGTLIEANLAPLEAAGLKREDVIGKPFWETYWWSYSETVQQQLRDALRRARDGETVRYETPVRVKNNTLITIDVTFGPLRNEEQLIIGIVGFAVDVTENRRAQRALEESEERLARLRDELAHLSRLGAVGELTAGIAHELNQPLAAIANYAYALRNRLEPDAPARCDTSRALCINLAHRLEEQSVRGGDIIRRLLRLARNQPSTMAPVHVRSLASDVVELLEFELREAEITLEVDIPDDLPSVTVDPIQIQQVLFNLCRNAIDALHAVPAERRMEISARLPEPEHLEIRVRDWGPGVAVEILSGLFTPFATTKPHGLGFGLVLSRRIVEAHGGRLEISPDVTPGAEFRLRLPLCP